MKILEINSVPYGSTCNIMLGIRKVAENTGIRIDTATGYSYHPVELPKNHIYLGGFLDKSIHMFMSYFTGFNGFFSYFSTYRLLKKIQKEQYNIIHLHNIHGWYLNLPIFFNYLKNHDIKVIWTLHDCWAFTGQCPHFAFIKCDKWKTKCYECQQYKKYPPTLFDNSRIMYGVKNKLFTGVKNLTLITPSKWLADLVKQSFLKEYSVNIINNGIDLTVFKPNKSDLKKRYNCENKFIVLGVAFGWDERKGLDVFIKLAKKLDKNFQIVLVGTDDKIKKLLPSNIIAINRTQNQQELAEIYTAADVFVNPTREEVFGLVNVEALACGTPIITFRTGGSPETLNNMCGSVVEYDDVKGLIQEIKHIKKDKPYSAENCRKQARNFDQNKKFKEYIDLYRQIK